MSFITHLNLRNCEILPQKLDRTGKFTMSGLSACIVSIGSAGDSTDPPRGCFDLRTSDSTTAYFESTSATGVAVISIKTPSAEYHLTNDDSTGSLTIGSTGGTGYVSVPNLCAGSITAGAGGGVWTNGGNDCIYYNNICENINIFNFKLWEFYNANQFRFHIYNF